MAKILFIEDDQRWQKVLQGILETAGHSFDSADTFAAAVVKMDSAEFDVIVFDLFLDAMQSAVDPLVWVDALIEGLRARKLRVPPIIIITGYPISQSQIVRAFTEHRNTVFNFFDKSDFDKRGFLHGIKDAVEFNRSRPGGKSLVTMLAFAVMMTLILLSTFAILVWGTSQVSDPQTQQTLLRTGSALIIVTAIFISIFSQGTKVEKVLEAVLKAWRG